MTQLTEATVQSTVHEAVTDTFAAHAASQGTGHALLWTLGSRAGDRVGRGCRLCPTRRSIRQPDFALLHLKLPPKESSRWSPMRHRFP